MKNFFKGLLKVFLGIITFISMIVLIIDLTIYSVRNISEQFLNEKEIRKMVENINVLDLLKDEDGNEIKEITEIKEQLINAGIPTETVEEFINSEPVKNLTTNILTTTIDYVVYNKKIETKEISEEEIYDFVEQNIYEAAHILKEKNVPKSEELTDERINKILIEVKKEVPVIREQVQEISSQIEEKIKETEQYETLEDYKNNLDDAITLIRFIYSDYITNMIITIGIVSIILIVISRLSYYAYLKWIGLSFTISGIILYISSKCIDLLTSYKNEIPYIFQSLFDTIINDSKSLFISKANLYILMGIMLIIANIVIAKIKDNREDKKIDL